MALFPNKIFVRGTDSNSQRTRRKFIGSLAETAARAVVTASVTFAVGLLLKRSFEKGVAQAAEAGAAAGAQAPPSEPVFVSDPTNPASAALI